MGDDPERLYRLDRVAHIARVINDEPQRCIRSMRRQQGIRLDERYVPYLQMAGLYHLARLNDRWFRLDEPLDVTYQLGLPVDGRYVSGCLTDFQIYIQGSRPAWETFGECPEGADEKTVRHFAHAYIMMLLGTQLFADKSGNRIHIRWLPYVARLEEMGTYSWGSAALAWLYRCMCRVTNRHVVKLAGPLQLLQSWIFWRFPRFRSAGYDACSWSLASRYFSQTSLFQFNIANSMYASNVLQICRTFN
ncbi:protein MAIN-LIKE 1-like [Arachis duranensis]|uniref:Protein MAIN-LIKE 1-like n=1 Tax=Arachis duranensis TaxID=130453 RepID=A0A6P4CQK4_ARADU|nr:protein MAIN-LIKE 1-like [Arachis duranensis]